jgi:hypothetical protein
VEGARTRITSVPYALRSADADTLGGHPASAYQLAPTSTAANDHSATGATSTAKDTARSNAATDAVQAGTTNMVAKYVNSTDVGNSAIFESGGLVGINVNQPLDALHVRFTNTGGSMTGLAVQNMGNTAASYSGMLFYDQNGQLGQFGQPSARIPSTTSRQRLDQLPANPARSSLRPAATSASARPRPRRSSK